MPRGKVGLRGCLLVGGLRRGIGGVLEVEREDVGFVMMVGGFPVRRVSRVEGGYCNVQWVVLYAGHQADYSQVQRSVVVPLPDGRLRSFEQQQKHTSRPAHPAPK
jgi:hypothetical protein